MGFGVDEALSHARVNKIRQRCYYCCCIVDICFINSIVAWSLACYLCLPWSEPGNIFILVLLEIILFFVTVCPVVISLPARK